VNENFLLGLALIIFLGISAQWVAWRFRLPSILLLLLFGFAAGPVLNIVNPDAYFGPLLFPIVSISVAVILFEGGLSLKISEFKSVGKVVINLITFGILITWSMVAAAAYFILELDLALSILFGAILVVTGPTVILPILRHVRPTPQINSILKWEGILNDPVGALLAILVFEVIIAATFTMASTQVIGGLLKTIILSSSIGLAGAYAIVLLLKYKLIPDFLQNSISLAFVVCVFAVSNLVQAESGLFAVTLMGIFLANQKTVTLTHIIDFKENIRVILLSVLFIILAARVKITDLEMLNLNSLIFVAALILIIRPAAVYLSTLNTNINWREKIFIAWMAPRGIVAAAVASVFAIELTEAGYEAAASLVPIMFLVILITIAVYGISAIPLAKWLKVASPNQEGAIILGANPLALRVGKALQNEGFVVMVTDTNFSNITEAKMEELPTFYGNILGENVPNEIDLSGIGKLLALTPNQEINSLAALYFSRIFGAENVFQLPEETITAGDSRLSQHLKGEILFGEKFNYSELMQKLDEGLVIKSTKITEKFNFSDYLSHNENNRVIPLFLISKEKKLRVYTPGTKPTPSKGDTLLSLTEKDVVKSNGR
jgi:NhaP-type Na+/H+ or K+/H+ antiporter